MATLLFRLQQVLSYLVLLLPVAIVALIIYRSRSGRFRG